MPIACHALALARRSQGAELRMDISQRVQARHEEGNTRQWCPAAHSSRDPVKSDTKQRSKTIPVSRNPLGPRKTARSPFPAPPWKRFERVEGAAGASQEQARGTERPTWINGVLLGVTLERRVRLALSLDPVFGCQATDGTAGGQSGSMLTVKVNKSCLRKGPARSTPVTRVVTEQASARKHAAAVCCSSPCPLHTLTGSPS